MTSSRGQESNRLEVASDVLAPSIKTLIEELDKPIKQARDTIGQHIDGHPELKQNRELLQSVPGVGTGHHRSGAALVGLNPKQRQSGISVRGKARWSKTGSSALRKAFYLPTVVAMKHNPILRAFCERLRQTGQPTIIGAVMRKLIHPIYGSSNQDNRWMKTDSKPPDKAQSISKTWLEKRCSFIKLMMARNTNR